MKVSMIQLLRRLGFDRSTRTPGGWHIACSQCAALVINGTACHETGCPNAKQKA